jgi:hypothetical protein
VDVSLGASRRRSIADLDPPGEVDEKHGTSGNVATIGMSRPGRIDETLPPAWVESMTARTSSGP